MRILVPMAVLAVVLGGCSGRSTSTSAGDFKGDEKAVARVVDDLAKAGRKRDGKEVCASVFAKALTHSLGDCTKVVRDQLGDADVFDLDVQRVTVTGDTATAAVKGKVDGHDRVQTLRFVREGRAWRLAGLVGR